MHCKVVRFDSSNDYGNAAILRHCAMPLQAQKYSQKIQRKSGHVVTLLRQFTPNLPSEPLRRTLKLISRYRGKELVESLRQRADAAKGENTAWALDESATLLVLADLAAIGWKFRVVGNTIYMVVEPHGHADPKEAKLSVRKALAEARSQQLSESSTQSFFAYMHRDRLVNGKTISVDNLIDDGASLAKALRKHREGDLKKAVDPYIQLVDEGSCPLTGYKLQDIWRYFRHTWSTEYRPTPGRSLSFLIRNRARKYHPVMGIVSLANAVMQLRDRDDFIGWTSEGVVKRIVRNASFWGEFRQMALGYLREAREAIRSDDLLMEIGECDSVAETVKRLQAIAAQEHERRKSDLADVFQEAQESNRTTGPTRLITTMEDGSVDWVALSETPLYRRKRAGTLADILFAEHQFEVAPPDGELILGSLSKELVGERYRSSNFNADFDRAFKIAVREVKKAGVATRIMDVNVCGASPVYREILGGKLAALSLFAEEVQKGYAAKYCNAISEIASGMAGRPIVKPARISVLTTTSLYGVGSSQYNRVRMKFGTEGVEWKKIGATEGYGTIHMTRRTIEALREVSTFRNKRRNVNNQFGEGTSPLMRQMREGLTFLGFDSDAVLQHSQCRIVYLLELYPGACDDLVLIRDRHPKAPSMAEVAKLWLDRWLSMRVQNEDVLNRVAMHSAAAVKADLVG